MVRNVGGGFSCLEEDFAVRRTSPLMITSLIADNMLISRILIKLLLTSGGINIIKIVLLNRMSSVVFHAFWH